MVHSISRQEFETFFSRQAEANACFLKSEIWHKMMQLSVSSCVINLSQSEKKKHNVTQPNSQFIKAAKKQ